MFGMLKRRHPHLFLISGAVLLVLDVIGRFQTAASIWSWVKKAHPLLAGMAWFPHFLASLAILLLGLGILQLKWKPKQEDTAESQAVKTRNEHRESAQGNTARFHEDEELIPTSDGPNIGVEYNYSEANGLVSAPLILVNTSPKDSAHNVRVMPIAVGDLEAIFDPDVVPFIEPLEKKPVKAVIPKVFPTLRQDFPVLFKRNYRDTSTEELFTPHTYTLLIEYENAGNTKLFESAVELRYTHWKTRITVGEIHRRLKRLI